MRACSVLQISKKRLDTTGSFDNGNVFLTRFPLHLSNELQEDKFGERSAAQPLLVHLLTDGYHQKLSPRTFFRYLRALQARGRVHILDKYLGVSDVFHGIWQGIYLSLRLPSLFNFDYKINGV